MSHGFDITKLLNESGVKIFNISISYGFRRVKYL